MKFKNLAIIAMVFALSAVIFASCMKDSFDKDQELLSETELNYQDEAELIEYSTNVIADSYIVIYKDDAVASRNVLEAETYVERQAVMKSAVQQTFKQNNIPVEKMGHVYGTVIKGFSATLNQEELATLRRDQDIQLIEQDQTFTVSMGGPPGGGGDGGGAQTTPWGITRVGGGLSGAGKTAWIIDSGIDQDHPDLNVNTALSESFLGGNQADNPDDQNGHGTHVAGTVGAIDNSEGVIGVAAGAEVIAVRVLDRRGSGSNSGVIAGVNYVGANASSGDAANMSLGGGVSTALDNAVLAASSACPFVLAAGNESTSANNSSPARVNGSNIYTVSSMTSTDNWSYFSNYGNPPVDYCAPGSSVYSTYKSGGYATLSGTSMAAPHVCGLLLIGNLNSDGNVNGDPDGNPDPIAHH